MVKSFKSILVLLCGFSLLAMVPACNKDKSKKSSDMKRDKGMKKDKKEKSGYKNSE